jgi:multiple sugar transport system ATP-binding protein
MAVYDQPATQFVGSFIGSPPMNFLQGKVTREDGRVRVAIGGQALSAPRELADQVDEEVLVGIRAENIDASASSPPPFGEGNASSPLPLGEGQGESKGLSGTLAAETMVVEPLGSHLLLTATVEGQQLKVITRTDFETGPGQRIWLRPQAGKLRWLRNSNGESVDFGGRKRGDGLEP